MFKRISDQIDIGNTDDLDLLLFYKKTAVILFKFSVYLVFPLLVVGSYMYVQSEDYLYSVLELALGVVIVLLVYSDNIHYERRTTLILFNYFVAAYFVLITTGVNGGGFVSLMVTITFFGLLTRKIKTLYLVFGLNTLVLTVLTILMYTGALDDYLIVTYKNTWIFLILLFTTYTIGILYALSYYKEIILSQFKISDEKRYFLDNLVNSVGTFLVTIDKNGYITMSNQAFNDFFNQGEKLVGENYEVVINSFLEKYAIECSCDRTEFDSELTNGDFCIELKSGTKYINRRVKSLLHSGDKQEKIIIMDDVTIRKENEARLRHLSYNDQLTGLYNRRFYETELVRLDSIRSLPLTMIMIDVNGLKLINDSFGHKAGDEVLIKTAECIKQVCRDVDIVSRVGGDEFILILPNVTHEDAVTLSKRLLKNAKKYNVSGVQLSFSVGIGTKTTISEDINEIYRVMEDELYKNKLWESQSMRSTTIDLILRTLYEKNNREMLHSKRVSKYSEQLAKIIGLNDNEVEEIKLAGLMHDIGKIGIEEAILNKPGRLDELEWERMKQHSEIGYRILSSVSEFSRISEMVLHHHENVNGSGYPAGDVGDDITIGARIIRITDAYDAMTGERTYNTPMSKKDTIKELQRNKGTIFDAKLVDTFINKVVSKL